MVVHGLRGRPSNRRIAQQTQAQALDDPEAAGLARFRADVRPRATGEAARIEVSKETLRGWMMEAGLWKSKPQNVGGGALLAAAAQRVWRVGAVGHFRLTTGWKGEGRCATWCG